MYRTLSPEFDAEMTGFLEEINLRYSYDFRNYAPASMKRNLVQAMTRLGSISLPELLKKVVRDAESFEILIQSLVISVSEMFRDPDYFRSIREKVVPHLKTYPSLKIWVAGCSTGEEVYSLAIILEEEELLERTIIYGTDISPKSLEMAKAGAFPLGEVQSATPNYFGSGGRRSLSDYYTCNGGVAQMSSSLATNVTFSDHSLATDAVFAETHLISCRNVLIYFDRTLQERAIGLFNDSLCRKGFLGLGSQETVRFSSFSNCFKSLGKEGRLFQKI